MTRSPYLAIAATVALCAPAAALAASPRSTGHGARVYCGGSGVNSLYCIPQQSVFSFTHITKDARCSIQAVFTVEPKIPGLKGHAHIELQGVSRKDRRIARTARPLVGGGPYSVTFTKLRAGAYQLTGWYEGDGTRLASAHHTKRFTLHCG